MPCIVITPSLDSSKLKQLSPILLECIKRINHVTGNTIRDINLNHHNDLKLPASTTNQIDMYILS
jgi:uncharacterized protein (DUF1810 family)